MIASLTDLSIANSKHKQKCVLWSTLPLVFTSSGLGIINILNLSKLECFQRVKEWFFYCVFAVPLFVIGCVIARVIGLLIDIKYNNLHSNVVLCQINQILKFVSKVGIPRESLLDPSSSINQMNVSAEGTIANSQFTP